MSRNKILLIISLFLNLLLAVTIILLIVFGRPFNRSEDNSDLSSEDTQEILDDLILQVPDTDIDDKAELDDTQEESSKERNISVYYFDIDKFNTPDNTDYVTAVTRETSRLDMATFALEEIIKGPELSDPDNLGGTFGSDGFVEFTSVSNCNGKDFTISVKEGLATVKFCRDIEYKSDSSGMVVGDQIGKTLKQFSTVQKVQILEKDGSCFDDMAGYTLDECYF